MFFQLMSIVWVLNYGVMSPIDEMKICTSKPFRLWLCNKTQDKQKRSIFLVNATKIKHDRTHKLVSMYPALFLTWLERRFRGSISARKQADKQSGQGSKHYIDNALNLSDFSRRQTSGYLLPPSLFCTAKTWETKMQKTCTSTLGTLSWMHESSIFY